MFEYLLEHDTFTVTSTDLIDGVWSDIISNTQVGQNMSPQLSWEPVEGATEYVIYMVDSNTNGFLHWKSAGITETELDAFMEEVDTDIYGNTGNIIAYGKISGTFTDARFRNGVEPSGPYTM